MTRTAMKTMANAYIVKMKPIAIKAAYTAKVNPIRKYIVAFGKLFAIKTVTKDKIEESASIPTIGPATREIIYPMF